MVTKTSAAGPGTTDPARTRRVELILRQVESLPTLPAIATRLLALTTDEQSEAREVVELISADQALTARILSICRKAEMGIREEATTVEKAVVLLGFNAVRNAVLSIKVFELYGGAGGQDHDGHRRAEGGPSPADAAGGGVEFNRPEFWRHCLAVAVAAEQLAGADRRRELNAGEAFVCGLLHDVGKLALDHVLPKSFCRVLELVEVNQGNIAEFERRIIGIDHHTAGKRLAEQWGLPHLLQDCIWLHGSPFDMLPQLPHRRMIGLVTLADLLARQNHLGYSGNFHLPQDWRELAQQLELDPVRVERMSRQIHLELERRCRTLGLDQPPSPELFMRSIQLANQMLGRLNAALDRRSRIAQHQARVLEAISRFHAQATPGRSVEDVLEQVVASAIPALGAGFYGIIYQSGPGQPWLIGQYNAEGRTARSQIQDPPSSCPDLSRLDASHPASLNLMGILPWVTDFLSTAPDLRQVRVLPLGCGWGTAALLLHDRPLLPLGPQLAALTDTWGAAIAAAGQHDGARRLGEELAQANTALAEAQDRLLQSESLTRLGEMAAGAAHEMNNPLAVISGRAQLLAQTLPAGSRDHQAAALIAEQAQRLSDLISLMRLFADAPKPQLQPTPLQPLLEEAVAEAARRFRNGHPAPPTKLALPDAALQALADAGQLRCIVSELVLNAMQAGPRTGVTVSARLEADARRLALEVVDDGAGMDPHTLSHALDPFFSNRPAGRGAGLGLAKARLFVQGHNGHIELRSSPGQGTTALVLLPLDSPS